MSLIGHASQDQLRRYQRAKIEPTRATIEAIAERLGLNDIERDSV